MGSRDVAVSMFSSHALTFCPLKSGFQALCAWLLMAEELMAKVSNLLKSVNSESRVTVKPPCKPQAISTVNYAVNHHDLQPACPASTVENISVFLSNLFLFWQQKILPSCPL